MYIKVIRQESKQNSLKVFSSYFQSFKRDLWDGTNLNVVLLLTKCDDKIWFVGRELIHKCCPTFLKKNCQIIQIALLERLELHFVQDKPTQYRLRFHYIVWHCFYRLSKLRENIFIFCLKLTFRYFNSIYVRRYICKFE